MLSDLNYGEIVQRMIVTFIEAALAPLIGLALIGDYSPEVLELAVMGGVGAVLSLVYNLARELNSGGEV